jgi:hypothetical protein
VERSWLAVGRQLEDNWYAACRQLAGGSWDTYDKDLLLFNIKGHVFSLPVAFIYVLFRIVLILSLNNVIWYMHE